MSEFYALSSRTIVVDGKVCVFTLPCGNEPSFLRETPPRWKAMLTRSKLALDKVDNLDIKPEYAICSDTLKDKAPITKYKPRGVYNQNEWIDNIIGHIVKYDRGDWGLMIYEKSYDGEKVY